MGDVRRRTSLLACLLAATVLPCASVSAQTTYFNTDAGRPLRIEDAVPTERYGLELMLPTARMEHLDAGAVRWRFEPGISYGILPQTEMEFHATFVYREATATPRGGLASVDLTLLHALNTETLRLPAVALAAEVYVPAGAARTGGTAWSIRTLGTRSGTAGRLHFNASLGSYNIAVTQPTPGCLYGPSFNIPCTTTGPTFPYVPDGPCLVASSAFGSMACNGRGSSASATSDTVPQRGTHWLVGAAFDHAIVLHSTLLTAEIFAERYVGLYGITDWTAEVGVRHQVTPTVGFDAGVGRHFHGTTLSWLVMIGATYSAPLRLFQKRSP